MVSNEEALALGTSSDVEKLQASVQIILFLRLIKLVDILPVILPDSDIAKQITLGLSKILYCLPHRIGPS